MALTDTQKAQVRYYLGYPDGNRELHSDLEGALVALSTDGETIVTALLTSLSTLDAKLSGLWSQLGVVKAEEVTLAGAEGPRALRVEGRRLAHRLAAILGVSVQRDVFGTGPVVGVPAIG